MKSICGLFSVVLLFSSMVHANDYFKDRSPRELKAIADMKEFRGTNYFIMSIQLRSTNSANDSEYIVKFAAPGSICKDQFSPYRHAKVITTIFGDSGPVYARLSDKGIVCDSEGVEHVKDIDN